MIDAGAILQRWEAVGSQLDEQGRRLFAAAEARSAGWGGLAVSRRSPGSLVRRSIGHLCVRCARWHLVAAGVSVRKAETVLERANEVLTRATDALSPWGFDCDSLDIFKHRLETGHLPADEIVATFERKKSVPGTLRHLCDLH